MPSAAALTSGILGGATTSLTRSVTRRAMHDRLGRPRVPRAVRRRNGLGTMLMWAAAMGVLLALADVMREQRQASGPSRE